MQFLQLQNLLNIAHFQLLHRHVEKKELLLNVICLEAVSQFILETLFFNSILYEFYNRDYRNTPFSLKLGKNMRCQENHLLSNPVKFDFISFLGIS